MIRAGYSSINESYTGELAKAVKNLSTSQKKSIARGLGDVDIEHSDMPMTKLSSARDPRIKSKDCYFFLVYKEVPSGKLTVAVTDEIHSRMVLDAKLAKVENADGAINEVNSKVGNLNWTNRINYAYAIYMLKASDAASAAELRSARAESKKGSSAEFGSPNHRASAETSQWMNYSDPGRYDKSGYKRPTARDWEQRMLKLSNNEVLDLSKEIESYTKLFDQVLSSFSKYLLSYKGNPQAYNSNRDSIYDYRNLMIKITDQIRSVQRQQSEMSKYSSPEDYFNATRAEYHWDEDIADNIRFINARHIRERMSLKAELTKI